MMDDIEDCTLLPDPGDLFVYSDDETWAVVFQGDAGGPTFCCRIFGDAP